MLGKEVEQGVRAWVLRPAFFGPIAIHVTRDKRGFPFFFSLKTR